ncbi:flavin-dependent oxidoreductase [Sedimentitalea sp. CY04]|uniref:Flavin-dependent oxidoreductase n=1 Tax=Parasedimentitalea denitrificans TaxID=2211118 RepID=A0ABX0W405_9RHOB|nr:flavin-dependent oxidoreductase [Sedimentitalea sp. CY04]NIZ60371.1 flavin-dependent oxidoreductase [Sedimentitalea sp. CY04]
MTILIAGGGIAGLTLGLTLHQIGVPFHIYEATAEIKPMGVGINLQPNAVRELLDLDLADELDAIGVKTQQYGFYSKLGKTIWEEPRGTWAGYSWPQYSVHRGELQMMLYRVLLERAGPGCITTGARASSFENTETGATLLLADGRRIDGDLVIAADGIHSALRAQIAPSEGAPVWNGRILWRATTRTKAMLGGAAMVMIGHDHVRLVAYPISKPDENGIATLNWIAEKSFDPSSPWKKEDWNRAADINDFLPDFADWQFDWIDVPALIKGAEVVYEYPMVDRDPLDQWTFGNMTLMGDAAHPTYPVGSNGAGQAIIDARVIGARILQHGVTAAALQAFEDEIRPVATGVGLANRSGNGPDGVLQRVEDLCGGDFDDIDSIIPVADLAAHAEKYKALAGFSIETLNAKPSIIAGGAHV